jgi:hypothetical protein
MIAIPLFIIGAGCGVLLGFVIAYAFGWLD